jgi:hypothetical protein
MTETPQNERLPLTTTVDVNTRGRCTLDQKRVRERLGIDGKDATLEVEITRVVDGVESDGGGA